MLLGDKKLDWAHLPPGLLNAIDPLQLSRQRERENGSTSAERHGKARVPDIHRRLWLYWNPPSLMLRAFPLPFVASCSAPERLILIDPTSELRW